MTLTPSTPDAMEVHVLEFSGLATTLPVDQVASAAGTGPTASSGASTTTVNGELVFGYRFLFNTASAGAGYTGLSLVNGDLDEYLVQSTAGSVAATFTQTSGTWFALMATFKPASSPTSSISGTVSPSSIGSATTMTLSGASNATVIADSSGNYSFPGLANGIYTVTPTQTGFTFAPTSTSVTINGANVAAVNLPDSLPLPRPGAFQGTLVLLPLVLAQRWASAEGRWLQSRRILLGTTPSLVWQMAPTP